MGSSSLLIRPLGEHALDARVVVPGSKSYTNRALMVATLASGTSCLRGALFSDDTRHMSEAVRRLGVEVTAEESEARFEIVGGDGRLAEVETELFVGNSGTTARFVTAALALGAGRYRVDGVPRMRQRPMRDLLDALRSIGVSVEEHGEPGCLPVTVSGASRRPGPARFTLPGSASSQFITGLLLAAPYFGGEVCVDVDGELVSKPYLDLTAQVMEQFGVGMENDSYRRFVVPGAQRYQGRTYDVEPDASAASYFFAAAAMLGGKVTVEGLGTESRQGDYRLVDLLERMGARVEREPRRTTVIGGGPLRGIEVDMSDLSDVAQTLAMVATCADSPTRITGIGFIRDKETDRVGNVVNELRKLGLDAMEEADGYVVKPGTPRPGAVDTYDDHRMAMSFALLGLKWAGIAICDPGCTSKTFPDYFDVLERLRG